jgi:hypothetical protein
MNITATIGGNLPSTQSNHRHIAETACTLSRFRLPAYGRWRGNRPSSAFLWFMLRPQSRSDPPAEQIYMSVCFNVSRGDRCASGSARARSQKSRAWTLAWNRRFPKANGVERSSCIGNHVVSSRADGSADFVCGHSLILAVVGPDVRDRSDRSTPAQRVPQTGVCGTRAVSASPVTRGSGAGSTTTRAARSGGRRRGSRARGHLGSMRRR